MNWWHRRRSVPPTPTPTPDALSPRDIVAGYDEYVAGVRTKLTTAAITVVILGVLAASLGVLTSMAPDSQGQTPVLLPVSAELAVGGFSLLAAVAIALQLAVRAEDARVWAASAGDPPRQNGVAHEARTVGRRLFLSQFAELMVPVSLGLGLYVSWPFVVQEPLHLLGVLAPLAGGLIVAVVAADASAAADPIFSQRAQKVAWAQKKRRVLGSGLRTAMSLMVRPSAKRIAMSVAGLVLVPLAVGVSAASLRYMLLGELPTPAVVAPLAVAALVVAVLMMVFATSLFVLAMERDRVTLFAAATVFAMLLVLYVLQALQLVIDDGTPSASSALGGLLMLSLVVAPGLLAASSLRDRGESESIGLLRWIAVGALKKAIRQGVVNVNRPCERRNGMAIAAALLAVLVPLGYLLAMVADAQLRRAAFSDAPQRGGGWVRAARIVTWVTVVVGLSVAVVLVLWVRFTAR